MFLTLERDVPYFEKNNQCIFFTFLFVFTYLDNHKVFALRLLCKIWNFLGQARVALPILARELLKRCRSHLLVSPPAFWESNVTDITSQLSRICDYSELQIYYRVAYKLLFAKGRRSCKLTIKDIASLGIGSDWTFINPLNKNGE